MTEYATFDDIMHRAVGYCEAAKILCQKKHVHLLAPVVYLIGHSIELTLKGLLFVKECQADFVLYEKQKYGHDLKKLWDKSKGLISRQELQEKLDILIASYSYAYPNDVRYAERTGTTQTLVDFDSFIEASKQPLSHLDIILPDLAVIELAKLIECVIKMGKGN